MLRTFIILISFIAVASNSNAQDEIVLKKTGKALDYELDILEIKNDTLIYKAFWKTKRLPLSDVDSYKWRGKLVKTPVADSSDKVSEKQVEQVKILATKDTVTMRYKLGTAFIKNGRLLNPAQMLEEMKGNMEAYNEMNKARNNLTAGNIIGGVGGFLIGYPIGAVIGGAAFNLPMFAVGCAITAISVPFTFSYSKHAVKAVKLYNAGILNGPTSSGSIKLHLGFFENGPGAKLVF